MDVMNSSRHFITLRSIVIDVAEVSRRGYEGCPVHVPMGYVQLQQHKECLGTGARMTVPPLTPQSSRVSARTTVVRGRDEIIAAGPGALTDSHNPGYPNDNDPESRAPPLTTFLPS